MKQENDNGTSGKRRIPTPEEIAEKGICTTTLEVDIKPEFFNRYAIISYSGKDRNRYIPYERLGNRHNLSVTGIEERWLRNRAPFNRFFVLVEKPEAEEFLQDIRSIEYVTAGLDDLSDYSDEVRKRIVASLLVNSLNRYKETKSTYNYGRLYVMDEHNFHVRKKKDEIVCLSIEVNKYLVLTAKTVTLTKCDSEEEFNRYCYRRACFKYNHPLLGESWSGDVYAPFVYKPGMSVTLDEIYIQRKRDHSTRNTVAQYTWREDRLYNDKNGVRQQIIETVNEHYGPYVRLSFCHYPVQKYKTYSAAKFEKDEMALLDYYLRDQVIYIENPLARQDPMSVTYMERVKAALQVKGKVPLKFAEFDKEHYTGGMVLKLTTPKPVPEEEKEDGKSKDGTGKKAKKKNTVKKKPEDLVYTRKEALARYEVLQHCIYDAKEELKKEKKEQKGNDKKEETDLGPMVRKIMIELMVKEAIAQKRLHPTLAESMKGWTFYLFKNINQYIYGAAVRAVPEESMVIVEYKGLEDEENMTDQESFVEDTLEYFGETWWVENAETHRVMKKGGNTYLILDTEENSIVDVQMMEHLYRQHYIAEKDETGEAVHYQRKAITEMRQVGNVHDYIKGVFGYRIWERSPLIEDLPTYSYMVGENTGKDLFATKKRNRFPRTKRIVVLEADNREAIPAHLEEIEDMLHQVFGRYYEMESYPFPFKILQEYLERSTLIRKGIHWAELTSKSLNGE